MPSFTDFRNTIGAPKFTCSQPVTMLHEHLGVVCHPAASTCCDLSMYYTWRLYFSRSKDIKHNPNHSN